MDAKASGWVVVGAVGSGGKACCDSRIYEVDGLLFRVDSTRPTAAAEALREGSWQAFCLTGLEVQALLGARELSASEARLLEWSVSSH